MRHPVAHLQTKAEVHLISHAKGQTNRCHQIGLGATHQALRKFIGQSILHTPLWHLEGEQEEEEKKDRGQQEVVIEILETCTHLLT